MSQLWNSHDPGLRADPLADDTIAQVLGPWQGDADDSAAELISRNAAQWEKLRAATRLMAQWTTNASLENWKATGEPSLDAQGVAALEAYVHKGRMLPEWSDAQKIARAEKVFMDYGALSCVLLFCSSLPECYVLPDLSTVLHASGQLEQHTEYRIRSTAAMIFPIMMKGGMTEPAGSGIAQVLKVRLIHATIRHLILRGNPQTIATALLAGNADMDSLRIPEFKLLTTGSKDMFQTLYAHGWDVTEKGLPCSQEELAYTLLTFGYVFVRSLRCLSLPLSAPDESAYLHAWNVMGHVLGIEHSYMRSVYDDSEAYFADFQLEADKQAARPDPRPSLGHALMKTMEDVIPLGVLKPFPTLMTRHLCGEKTGAAIGIMGRVSFFSRAIFWLFMSATRLIDTMVRMLIPEFSIARFLTRIVGYHFMVKILMDQTRPLKLPSHLINQVATMMDQWSDDPKAPGWVNAVEDRLTTRGSWQAALRRD